MLTNFKPLLLLSLLALGQGLACAQGVLRDPTIPPPGVPLPSSKSDHMGGEASAVATPQPQSIIRITPVGGRKQAVIDGRTLQTGDQVKQWRLVSITANGIVLKDSRGSRTVPAASSSKVSKKPVSGPATEQ